jgi:hypothetical protein
MIKDETTTNRKNSNPQDNHKPQPWHPKAPTTEFDVVMDVVYFPEGQKKVSN